MTDKQFSIRKATPAEYKRVGQLMVEVYSSLEGFLKPTEHPGYYTMLENVGDLTKKNGTEILVAASPDEYIAGAVVYFGDMINYSSGGTATQEKNAAGFRFLAVDPAARMHGLGKLLTHACIRKAKDQHRRELIIHTTNAMKPAWAMYERIGFTRSPDLDFKQGDLEVFGFRFNLQRS